MARVKICGLNAPEAVAAALEAGADWLGFILFENSPRGVTPEEAGRLASPAEGRALRVAVLVDPSERLLAETARAMAPDIIQLHGQETPQRCDDARAYARSGVWKALGVSSRADIAAAQAYGGAVDGFVFDAKPPENADRPGGWGRAYDWRLLASPRPAFLDGRLWLLSGGLDPANVAAAVSQSGAAAVDVASGVESAPGVKDPDRIRDFIQAARAAQPESAA